VQASPPSTLGSEEMAWHGVAWQESCRHHQAGVLYGGLLTLDWPCLSNEARRFRGLIHTHAALGDAYRRSAYCGLQARSFPAPGNC
jgi:hypothetical protein